MGYVKTAKEVMELQAVMSKPQARAGRVLYVPFDTDLNFVHEVLPPGLKPGGGPASLTIGDWQGSNAGPYRAAFLMVSATPEHDENLRGTYCLSFFISSESAVLFGRPMMGEPKKLASIHFVIEANKLEATVSRLGTDLIKVTADLGEEVLATESQSRAFWYKHQPADHGAGLQYDPQLLMQINTQKTRKLQISTAEISLQSSAHDPVADIPLQRIRKAYYSEGDIHASCTILRTVDRTAFLPYAFSGVDNWTVLTNLNHSTE
ncbi:acetoacetate decarboxylase family protein [Luminiphilus sp.]|nr:acetoacetate decarboxylase family protein [Luminiphilus sp.]MDB3922994.1 acetoacetate decarboxylase family protein [Luminiphilus sp.]